MDKKNLSAQQPGLQDSTPYNDVYARSVLGDTGATPRSGNWTSPDIIPNGMVGLDADQLKEYVSADGWAKDYGKSCVQDRSNFVYFRAKNLGEKSQSGKLYLYWSKASLLLYPSLWQCNQLKLQSGDECYPFEDVAPGKAFISGTDFSKGAFLFKPEAISGDHYCLIGRIVTEDHPNPIPAKSEIKTFAEFIATHPAYVQRNVALVTQEASDISTTVDYEQGETGAEVQFQIECCNVPVGALVAFYCAGKGPEPAITMDQVTVTTPNEVVGIKCKVPAGFKADIDYHLWLKDHSIPSGTEPSISLKAIVVMDDTWSPRLRSLAQPLRTAGIINATPASIGPTYGITVGGHTTKLKFAKEKK